MSDRLLEIARVTAPVQDAPWPDVFGFELATPNPDLAIADILVQEFRALQPKVAEGARLEALNETHPAVSGDWVITNAINEAHAAEQAKLAEAARLEALNQTYPELTGNQKIDVAIGQALALKRAQEAEGARMHGLIETYPTMSEVTGLDPDQGGIR